MRTHSSLDRDDRARHNDHARSRTTRHRRELEEYATRQPLIMDWLQVSRENGPAMRADSMRLAACKGIRWVELLWRTGEETREAPPKTRFLEVLAEPLRMVSSSFLHT